jgi:hypothetical protein
VQNSQGHGLIDGPKLKFRLGKPNDLPRHQGLGESGSRGV